MGRCQLRFIVLLFALFLAHFAPVNSQGSNVCTLTGGSENKLEAYSGPSRVLYVIVKGDNQDSYLGDMQTCANWLKGAVNKWAPNTNSSVDVVILNSYATLPDLTPYNQIWVVDLSSEADNTATKVNAMKKVAAWWEQRGRPHVILDARYISSCWHPRKSSIYDKDVALIENYFVNLRIRGGGLFLGTDHHVFQNGINEIPKAIGIKQFCCYFHVPPYKMMIDHENPIFNYPQIAYYENDPGLTPKYYIWDDSSTGDVAYNIQQNGLMFYPLGWHYTTGLGTPGVSATIRGSVGFLVTITSPGCHDRFEFATSVHFSSNISDTSNPPYTYTWTSNLDGKLSNSPSFNITTLSIGAHIITLRVVDKFNTVAEAFVSITIFKTPGSNETEGPVIAWNGNKDVQTVWPIRRPQNVTAYYNLMNGRANTPDALETLAARSGNIFFYDDGKDLYVAHIFGNPVTDTTESTTAFTVSFPDLVGIAGGIVFRDPIGSTQYTWNSATGTGSAKMVWKSGTAGFVAGPLPRNFEFCLHYAFDKLQENNVAYYMARGHTEGSFDLPNPHPILAFRSAAHETASLSLCWRQFKCPAEPKQLDSPQGFITNSIVHFAYDGSLFNYTDNSNCYWVASPQTSPSVPVYAIWFRFKRFAQQPGDRVIIRNGTDSNSPQVYQFDGSSPADTTTHYVVEGAQSLRFESVPSNDGLVDSGFGLDYFVVPTAISVSPSSAPYSESTVVTITGGNFYEHYINGVARNKLYCKVDGTVVQATYVNHETITCKIPAHPSGSKVNVPLSVSNDGVEYSNNITWSWIDASCANYTHCGSCLQNATQNCRWCNAGSFCFAAGDENVNCNENDVDVDCCTQCQTLSGCSSGQGICNCNNTCTCLPGFRDEDCGCRTCPIHPVTNTSCGASSDPTVMSYGECGCDGVCQCTYGFNGPACECPYCPFSGSEQCGGHGTCNCGVCVCDDGWEGEACECPSTCPSANGEVCSGHGTCQCGQCICEDGWRLLDDCSCRERCGEKGCSGNGECQCDGTCLCYPGFTGDDCEIAIPCNSTTCEDCLVEHDGICGWCPDSLRCENKYLRLACDRPRPKDDDQLPYAKECPVETIVSLPPTVDPTVINIGASVSAVALAGLIALAAFILYRRRNAAIEDANPWVDDPNDASVVANPLYEASTFQGANPLYEKPEGAP